MQLRQRVNRNIRQLLSSHHARRQRVNRNIRQLLSSHHAAEAEGELEYQAAAE